MPTKWEGRVQQELQVTHMHTDAEAQMQSVLRPLQHTLHIWLPEVMRHPLFHMRMQSITNTFWI